MAEPTKARTARCSESEADMAQRIRLGMVGGGKDAFIVCDDADLEQAVHASLAG